MITALPVYLAFFHPGRALTRNVIAVAQMFVVGALIHLSGGRIETHFHVFGSLAFLAFYRDWKVLVPATLVVTADHLLRQLFWPESVYGIVNPEMWRFAEHTLWVVFEDVFLVLSCLHGTREMCALALKQAELEASHDSLVKSEKLAALGQLAATVGHELRNPLFAVRSAGTYIKKRFGDTSDLQADKRIPQFLDLIEREVATCTKIIADLLDFARERPTMRAPCPLRVLVEEA